MIFNNQQQVQNQNQSQIQQAKPPEDARKQYKKRKSKFLYGDRDTRILRSHCDLCNDELPQAADSIEYRIAVLDEIDDSYESEYDKHEPRLLLCSFCVKEYGIPSYFQP